MPGPRGVGAWSQGVPGPGGYLVPGEGVPGPRGLVPGWRVPGPGECLVLGRGVPAPVETPQWLLLWEVCILLECILVLVYFRIESSFPQ